VAGKACGSDTLAEISSLLRLLTVRNQLKMWRYDFGTKIVWDKKDVILENEPEKLLITKVRPRKTNPNEPKNEAGKLLKIRSCGKNKPGNEPEHLVENKG
ncbi:MAG TPA: hypothetical protein VNM47_05390, partial [Terriglobia bacterium]|nr:hypothetical protein [Terriglobia bacterium]